MKHNLCVRFHRWQLADNAEEQRAGLAKHSVITLRKHTISTPQIPRKQEREGNTAEKTILHSQSGGDI
jgi:hypothetical protein